MSTIQPMSAEEILKELESEGTLTKKFLELDFDMEEWQQLRLSHLRSCLASYTVHLLEKMPKERELTMEIIVPDVEHVQNAVQHDAEVYRSGMNASISKCTAILQAELDNLTDGKE